MRTSHVAEHNRLSAATGMKVAILLFAMFMLLICSLVVNEASATEGGGSAYPNGAEDFMAGAVPPPGFYFLNYFTYYSADKFKLSNGEIPNFDLKVTADTLRFLYVSTYQILGGNWGAHIFVPFLNVDVTLPVGSNSKFGLGDIIVDPFILSWHSKNWHALTAIDIFIPTGSYEKDRLANPGRNYWTFEPIVGATYMSDGGFEVSGKFMYDFNTKNNDTNYLSGQEFHVDYIIAQKLGNFGIGANGYFYYQTSKDKKDSVTVPPDGFKGRAIGLGPAVKYDYKNMSFILKYLWEFDVKNRPQGQQLWFKFVYGF